ncbi:TAXI family TRAP transporter solute-binding subunit [Bacillus sp. MRMR6]|uniref:TAXI family TRAP transporter solute-binding subunit n=1 Tax=Bacillus sp. MRMR6 TaxID=1928617 RepID=UPI000950DCE9|nr:TAXI family TRAP transporter solute-binding subunit [Bacillus sp. MRMR6]OLS37300.1 TRAP transporter [Bacillus sp. MRMR6]
MNNWKRKVITVFTGLSLLVLAACSGGGNQTSSGEGGEVKYKEYPTTVKVGTASQGGTYFIVGGGLANLLEQKLEVTANVEVTGGPVHNMQLVQAGDQDVGMVTLGPAYEGYTGTGEWTEGNKMEDVRIIFPMFTTPMHWLSLESSGITKLEDIKGKRVGAGPAGGTAGTYVPMIHEVLGLDTANVHAGWSDLASQMMDGQLDVIGFGAGIPISAVTEIEVQRDVNFFGVDGETRDKIIKEFPYFMPFTIPADTYTTLDRDLETISMFNFGIVRKDANEDFVYDLVKAYHENQEMLIQTHTSMEESVAEAIKLNKNVPLHPGAIKYYEEIGIELPKSVYPPEWKN